MLLAAFDVMCEGADEGVGVDGWGLPEDEFGAILDAHDAGAGRVHGWIRAGVRHPWMLTRGGRILFSEIEAVTLAA